MSNPWKDMALRIARQASSGLDRLILQAAAQHVVSEEGFRVALAAVGREPEAGLVEHLRDMQELVNKREAEQRAVLCPTCGKRASFFSAGARLQPGGVVIAVPGYYCTDLDCTHGWTIRSSSQEGP